MASQGSVSEHKEASVIHGHHVYKDIWTPVVGEELNLIAEDSNDKYAATVDKRIATPTSVHVARFTSCHAHPIITGRHLFEVRCLCFHTYPRHINGACIYSRKYGDPTKLSNALKCCENNIL